MGIEGVETRHLEAGFEERALVFACGGEPLYGILSMPTGGAAATRGVLVVVGGPQYRAGSHRQFTLLARDLAQAGVPVLRFDYRGMGDSGGVVRAFDDVNLDLRTAIDAFMAGTPGLREVVLWGLCDAASAIGMYAAQDPRVTGLVLLNPWVRTEEGLARATLRHYYSARLRDPAFWRQLLRGGLNWRASLASLVALLRKSRRQPASKASAPASLPERMRDGLRDFKGQVLLVIAGGDLTAREFCDLADADAAWQGVLAPPRVTRRQIDAADHTFSRRAWRDQVARWTGEWLRAW